MAATAHGAADRDGERRQPAAGAVGAAQARDGDSRRDGRGTRRADGATADRSAAAGDRGRHSPAFCSGRSRCKLLIARIAGDDADLFRHVANWNGRCCCSPSGCRSLTGLLFGLYPAWDGARASVAMTLKDESGQSSATGGHGARPQGAGVRAGDDLGDPADPDRAVPEEPGEPAARGSGDEDGERDRLRHLALAERL